MVPSVANLTALIASVPQVARVCQLSIVQLSGIEPRIARVDLEMGTLLDIVSREKKFTAVFDAL